MRRSHNRGRVARIVLRRQPDSRLVSLSREGEERAFEEIVRRYRDGLVAYARTVVPGHRAEDVVQTALIKAHRAIRAGDAEIRLSPWLYTITRNTALNDLREQSRRERVGGALDSVREPPEIAERRRELTDLVRALHSLPTAQREAIVRHELEGQSHQEIAAALGSTRAAVRGLIFRARQALRDGIGMLVPIALLRHLLAGGAAPGGAAGAGGAAIGAAAGGGGTGIATKVGAGAVAAALVVGSGLALDRNHGAESGGAGLLRRGSHGDSGATARATQAFRPAASQRTGSGDEGRDAPGTGGGLPHGSGGPNGGSGDPGLDGGGGSEAGPDPVGVSEPGHGRGDDEEVGESEPAEPEDDETSDPEEDGESEDNDGDELDLELESDFGNER